MDNKVFLRAASIAVGLAFCVAASAQVPMRVLGNFANQLQSSEIEKPFFLNLGRNTANMFDVQFRTMDEVGLKGFDAMRMLKLGIFDVMALQLGYVSGDEPFVVGVDLPGVAPELATARKVAEAYRTVFAKRLKDNFNSEVVAMWPYPGQIFFCRQAISGLDDLRGKKVRTFTPPMAKFVEFFGGISVTLSFPEVYQGLQRGVIDCAISGSLSGNTSKWFEVSSHLYPLNIGWGTQAHVVNADYLRRLPAQHRETLLAQFRKMENELWDLAERTTQDGVNCNTSSGPCKYGVPAKMTLVPVRKGDPERMREAVQKAVLPTWSVECNKRMPDCAQIWNRTAGKIAGYSIK